MGIILLLILFKRGMFYEQFRCNIMIDRNTFPANIDVCKVKGCLFWNLYGTQDDFSM